MVAIFMLFAFCIPLVASLYMRNNNLYSNIPRGGKLKIYYRPFTRTTNTLNMKSSNSIDGKSDEDIKLSNSMKQARECETKGLSPGGGLATAEEQSDAAYADLINTSIDQRGIDALSEDELKNLERGGQMWEKGSKSKEPKSGFFGEVVELFKALNGGAHIEKDKFGET